MSIAPIIRSVEVKAPPERAFHVFTRDFGRWWPVGRTVGKNPHFDIVIEPHTGGRWFEVDEEGTQTQWGVVIAWEPPHRALFGWHLNAQFIFDPDVQTEVEVTFVAKGEGTLVTLEHRNLERLGQDAEKAAGSLSGGWPTMLGNYAAYVADHRN